MRRKREYEIGQKEEHSSDQVESIQNVESKTSCNTATLVIVHSIHRLNLSLKREGLAKAEGQISYLQTLHLHLGCLRAKLEGDEKWTLGLKRYVCAREVA
jgi:hypothetical protein